MRPLPSRHPLDGEGDRLIAESRGCVPGQPAKAWTYGGLSTRMVNAGKSREHTIAHPLIEIGIVLSKASGEAIEVAQIEAVIAASGLTDVQLDVLRLRMQGATLRDIAVERGTSFQAADNAAKIAALKVRRVYQSSVYFGLAQAYRQDTRRLGRRRGR